MAHPHLSCICVPCVDNNHEDMIENTNSPTKPSLNNTSSTKRNRQRNYLRNKKRTFNSAYLEAPHYNVTNRYEINCYSYSTWCLLFKSLI